MKKIVKLAVAVILLTSFFIDQKANALYGAFDTHVDDFQEASTVVTDKAWQSVTTAFDKVTSNSSYQLYSKEFFLDKVIVRVAKSMINEMQTGMVKWINSGYKGKPLFIQNPEVFYQNIYKAEVARVTNSLLKEVGGLRDLNRDVAREYLRLSTNEANRFTQSITPDYGYGICNNLAIKVNTISSKLRGVTASVGVLTEEGQRVERERLALQLNLAQSEYNANCRGSIKTQNEAQKACLQDFGCSGFEGMLSVVMNLGRNTEQGRLSTVIAETGKTTAAKTTNVRDELQQGGGFLSQRTCVEEEVLSADQLANGVTPKCIKEKVTTPGQAAVSSLDQVIKDPVQRAQLADEITQAVDVVASTFISKIIKDGLAYVTDGVNDVANSLDNELANLQLGIDGKPTNRYTPPSTINLDRIIQAPSSTSTVTPAPTGTILTADSFKDPNYEIANAEDKAEIVKPLMATIKTAITKNAKELTFINKEIAKHKEVLDAYTQVAMCYESKYYAQQSLISSGRHTIDSLGSYYFTYPEIIPIDYRKRGPDLDAIIKGLELQKINNGSAINNIITMSAEVDKTNNYKAVQYFSEKIEKHINDYLFVDTEWEQKDVKNSASLEALQYLSSDYGLYAKLDEEKNKLLDVANAYDENGAPNANATGLSKCNALRIEPPITDFSGGNGT